MSRRRLLVLLVAAARVASVDAGRNTCPSTVRSNYKSVSLIQAAATPRLSSRKSSVKAPVSVGEREAEDASQERREGPLTLSAEAPGSAGEQRTEDALRETWKSLLQARASSARHFVAHAVDRALGGSAAALAMRGGFVTSIIVIALVVAATCGILWHNAWSVPESVESSKEMAAAGKSASATMLVGAARESTEASGSPPASSRGRPRYEVSDCC
mmetsp:Transcript_3038/g.8202  ORF Transcript_3038/g.8202 Transcript_3038/m.8202 type:complete len:215 (-) Transcript_3038:50-694(-)